LAEAAGPVGAGVVEAEAALAVLEAAVAAEAAQAEAGKI